MKSDVQGRFKNMETSDSKYIDQRFAYPNWQGPFVWYGGTDGEIKLENDYVVIDVETTGLDAGQGARVIELSAIRTDGTGVALDSMTTLLNPNVESTGAEFIHGISLGMIESAPTFGDVWPQLAKFLSGAIFVAHHAKFDESFIAAEAKIAQIALGVMPGLCTYRIAKDSVTATPNHKLATLSDYYGLDSGLVHSAYDDALTVVQLLPHLLAVSGELNHYAKTFIYEGGPVSTQLCQR